MLYLLSVITFSLCQDAPFIESIEPAFGGFGSTIIINGSDFSFNEIDNTVFFGGLEANILNATENELMVLLKDKFKSERGRINCSLWVESGKWRWLGIQYVIAEY